MVLQEIGVSSRHCESSPVTGLTVAEVAAANGIAATIHASTTAHMSRTATPEYRWRGWPFADCLLWGRIGELLELSGEPEEPRNLKLDNANHSSCSAIHMKVCCFLSVCVATRMGCRERADEATEPAAAR